MKKNSLQNITYIVKKNNEKNVMIKVSYELQTLPERVLLRNQNVLYNKNPLANVT